ncbi:MAG: quinol oxidase subunit 4 [Chryseobacterium sp.]
MFMLTSCVVHHHGHGNRAKPLPPGQAKKIYGGSAKDYAPGQVKKRHRY